MTELNENNLLEENKLLKEKLAKLERELSDLKADFSAMTSMFECED